LDSLEDGTGPPDQLLNLVHKDVIPGDLLAANGPKRYPDAGDLLGKLIFRLKFHDPFSRDVNLTFVPKEDPVSHLQVRGKFVLEEFLLGPAHGTDVGDDVIEVRLVGLLQIFGEFL
jgi:hypothetical protein